MPPQRIQTPHLHRAPNPALFEPHLRATPRPHRHPHRGVQTLFGGTDGQTRGRIERVCQEEGRGGEAEANRADGGFGSDLQRAAQSQGLRDYCDMDAGTKDLLKAAIAKFSLSGRGYDRILKVSRTIANLEDSESIQLQHVAEAINYRAFDRKLFG